jgi:formylglycine-generating enzyme required for sulfatase activity
MKKSVFTLLALFAITGIFAQERPAIAVFPFEDMDKVFIGNEPVLFYRQFSNEFTNKNAGRFTIVPRQDVEKLINTEARFQLSDLSAKVKTAEMQSVLNGKNILSGIIGKRGNRITISISLYTYPDLGQLPGGVDITVERKDELFDKIPELVQKMLNAIEGKTTPELTNFIRVEGGTFQMGTASGGDDAERPVHTVTVKSFNIGKYQVTQKEWYEIMGTTVQHQRNMRNTSWPLHGLGDNYPMYYVNWYEAVEYCNRRSVKEGLTPAYLGSGNSITCDWNANGYRLPTEAEWEFAAKGGSQRNITTEYSGSNNAEIVAWYEDNSNNSTQPVGTKVANNLGIHDMSGNVWEWCWDWYGDYPNSSQTDPRGQASGAYRVLRGGAWSEEVWYLRSAYRNGADPSNRSFRLGFRLVRPMNN